MEGYSSNPLVKKLGIREGDVFEVINPPGNYFNLLTSLPEPLHINSGKKPKNIVHYFEKKAKDLSKNIPILKNTLHENGSLWVSWPKKASGVATDINEDLIRMIALQNGLVDIKVCAVDEIWSGLKLVKPLKDRRQY